MEQSTVALIGALGTLVVSVLGALGLIARVLMSELRNLGTTARTAATSAQTAAATLSPNGGSTIHDAVRRIEAKQLELVAEVSDMRAEKKAEHARLWAAITPRQSWRNLLPGRKLR